MAENPRHLLEYAGVRFALAIIDRLPLRVCEALARRIADLAFIVARSRRRIAVANVLRARVATDAGAARAIARRSFRHFAVLVLESLRSGQYFNADNWESRVELEVDPETRALLDRPGQGLIVASGHLGNWEIAAQLISFVKPVLGISRNLNNPYVDRLMQTRKPRNRFRLTPKHSADTGRLLACLKNGDVLALLIDQHARDRGMMINFFGVPASTHTSPALLHLVTRVPICFGYCARLGPMKYRFVAGPPVVHIPTGKRNDDVRALLEALTVQLEDAIRQYPDQYLWAHRRWRNAT